MLVDPSGTFKVGEVIRATASSQIMSTGAISATPYQWQKNKRHPINV